MGINWLEWVESLTEKSNTDLAGATVYQIKVKWLQNTKMILKRGKMS